VYIIYFRTLNVHLLVLISYLIAQCMVMDHLKISNSILHKRQLHIIKQIPSKLETI
jgi:hypothetical protein